MAKEHTEDTLPVVSEEVKTNATRLYDAHMKKHGGGRDTKPFDKLSPESQKHWLSKAGTN